MLQQIVSGKYGGKWDNELLTDFNNHSTKLNKVSFNVNSEAISRSKMYSKTFESRVNSHKFCSRMFRATRHAATWTSSLISGKRRANFIKVERSIARVSDEQQGSLERRRWNCCFGELSSVREINLPNSPKINAPTFTIDS